MKTTALPSTNPSFHDFLFQRIPAAARKIRLDYLLVILVAVAGAILLRASMIDFKSIDFIGYFRPWFNELKLHGFHAFKNNFFDYYPPYVYLVYIVIRLLPEAPATVATKIPSMAADFVCAFFAYRIARLKWPDGPIPLLAAIVVLFAPTVVINSALWAQTDSLFTTAILAGLYFLMIDRKWLGLIGIGAAFSFKAQTIFIAPLLFALCLRREVPWKSLLLIPLIMALALIPTWIAGRPLLDLLQIYPAQTGEFEQLTLNAPSLYAWLPDTPRNYETFFIPGLALGGAVALIFCAAVFRSRAKFNQAILLELALASFMVIPFFLPKMHERYFYPADILSVLYAVFFPAYFFVPIVMGAVSFFAYLPFLFGKSLVPMPVLALALFMLVCFLTWHLLSSLYPPPASEPEAGPETGLV